MFLQIKLAPQSVLDKNGSRRLAEALERLPDALGNLPKAFGAPPEHPQSASGRSRDALGELLGSPGTLLKGSGRLWEHMWTALRAFGKRFRIDFRKLYEIIVFPLFFHGF